MRGEATIDGSNTYSIGQMTYTTIESVRDDASLFQGAQIAFEVFEVASCPTDFNIDGITNGDDFGLFLGNFDILCNGCPTDLNVNGITDGADFGIFLGNFGLVCD